MKFGHDFKQSLADQGFPPHWVESAVPYRELKKCIKKVERELTSLGLDAEKLRNLVNSSPDPQVLPSQPGQKEVAFQYIFKDRTFQPTLILYIQADGGFAIDATLSPDTRRVLTKVSAEHQKGIPFLELPESQLTEVVSEPKSSEYHADPSTEEGIRRGTIKKVEVPLTFDAEFFGLLQQDVSSLEELQAEEQRNLTDEIEVVGKEIAALAMPGLKAKKSDLDVWREIFDIYLQAGIFFSTHEIGGGSRDSTAAAKQLNWFQDQVTKRELLSLIKKPASRLALDRFIAINIKLLRNLSFQEINQTAIRKILKKFDKRTSLNAKTTFPKLIQSEPFMSATMAKAVCASVSTQIVTTIPQLDDWSCQVCSDIAYKPIKLACQHMFCIRCMIQLQQRKERRCPMCRKATVLSADSTNVDLLTMHFLEKFFPKEVKAKQKENERALARDMYGEDYDKKCVVM